MEKNIELFVNEIKAGNIVAIPTDTVFGLFALPTINGMNKLNSLKKSPLSKKISLMTNNLDKFSKIIDLNESNLRLVKETLPGEITYIVPIKKDYLSKNTFPLKESIGIRVPNFKNKDTIFLEKILEQFDFLFATSANISGENVLKTSDEIKIVFPNILIKNETFSLNNKPTTIISLLYNKRKTIRE